MLGERYGIRISCNGMRPTLDLYISANYAEIRSYTNYFLVRMKSTISADAVINNSFLHCCNIDEEVTDQDKVKSILLNTIKMQILWSTSLTNRQEKIIATDIQMPIVLDDDSDLWDKIIEELRYQDNMSVIDIYRRGIKDRIKLIVFQTYFDKGYSTARAMAQYFRIPVTSAHYFIQEIKNDLKKLRNETKERVRKSKSIS